MWPFRRKTHLLEKLLELEERRLAHRSDLEAKRDELEVKKLEIELTHVEARNKAQIDLEAARQELRIKRQAIGRKAAQKRWANVRGEQEGAACPLCANPFLRNPTVEMIRAHSLHEQNPAPPAVPERPPEERN